MLLVYLLPPHTTIFSAQGLRCGATEFSKWQHLKTIYSAMKMELLRNILTYKQHQL